MSDPSSKREVNGLGEALRTGPADEAALIRLDALRESRHLALVEVQQRLRSRIGEIAGARLKRSDTIIAKLRRMPGLRLSDMQDIAGVRVVRPMNYGEQTSLSLMVVELFSDAKPRMVDRRLKPTHGYRAVHEIVRIAGAPVEIQIRTLFQHVWAQTMERFASVWGRQIQYGDPPDAADASVSISDQWGQTSSTRRELVTTLGPLSEFIASIEALQWIRSLRTSAHLLATMSRPPDGSPEPSIVEEQRAGLHPGEFDPKKLAEGAELAKAILVRLHGVTP